MERGREGKKEADTLYMSLQGRSANLLIHCSNDSRPDPHPDYVTAMEVLMEEDGLQRSSRKHERSIRIAFVSCLLWVIDIIDHQSRREG